MPIASCVPREALQQYIVGTIDESRSDEIEAHLAECQACEQLITELESHADARLDAAGEPEVPQSQAKSNADDAPSVVQRAMAAAKQLSPISVVPLATVSKLEQIGAYELLRPLGRGGMGQVVLARHRNLQKEVAIKLLTSLPGDRPELVSRFQREIRAAGHLSHPAIVNATDAGQEQGTHYLVMEYIAGLDLSRLTRLVGALAIADACELARQTALGLSYAHAEGIVHRDIKPSNLMLDANGRVKILDFGLAQLSLWDESGCELTTVGQLMGTLDYMAPEQAERFGPVDYRADLYALGATLFRLLAGRPPLAAAPNMTLLEKVRLLGSQTPPLLSSVREDCPTELVELVKRLLSRDPAQRPASAAHVAEALLPFCAEAALPDLLQRAHANEAAGEPRETAQRAPASPPDWQFRDLSEPAAPPNQYWRWIMAAGLVPLGILAGLFIVLDTQKGQLVIQSDVADVHVKIVREGELVKDLVVQPGAKSTRLRADKYEVTIDAPSDQVAIDKHQISIKAGETIVATIQAVDRDAATSPASAPTDITKVVPQPVAGSIRSSRATFSGKSLAEWLNTFESDRDTKIQQDALNAIVKLADESNAADVTERLIAVARQAKSSTWSNKAAINRILLFDGHRGLPFSLDFRVFGCLRAIQNEASFRQLMSSELLRGDDEWTSRWFAVLIQESYFPGADFVEDLLEPATLERYGTDSRTLALIYALSSLQRDEALAKKLAEKVIDTVASYPPLGRTAVLKFDSKALFIPDFTAQAAPRSTGGAIIVVEESIASFAKRVLADDTATPEELARASTRLANTTNIIDGWRTELIDVLKKRFRRLIAQPQRIFGVIPGDGPIPPVKGENFLTPSSSRSQLRFINSEPAAYLVLTERLSALNELSSELVELLEITGAAWQEIQLISRRGPFSRFPAWPFDAAQVKALPPPLDSVSERTWIYWFVYDQITKAVQSQGADIKRTSPLALALATNGQKLKFDLCDPNGDGKVSVAELAQSNIYLNFEDLNGDGAMDLDESIAAWLKEYLHSNEDQADAPEDATRDWAQRQFHKYDKNNDGFLSPEESAAMIVKPDGADENGDGFITVDEFVQYARKSRLSK